MLLVCPSCASEYTIDPEKLGADGRTVRCAICRDTWFVSPSPAASPNVSPVPEPETAAAPVAEEVPVPMPPPASRAPLRRSVALLAPVIAVTAGWLGWSHAPGMLDRLGEGVAQARAILEHATERHDGLAIRGLAAELARSSEGTELLVEGEIANRATREIDIPHLEILVRNGDEQVLATWTTAPPQAKLGVGETVRFTTRLSSPPPDGRQVRVHFTTASGIAVAVHSPGYRTD